MGGLFRFIKNGAGQVRCRMAQGQHFQCGAHFRNFADFLKRERSNANTAPWLRNRKPLCLQTTERLTHRNMACAEFIGNMILTQLCAWFQLARNNPLRQDAADLCGNRVCFFLLWGRLFGHVSQYPV